MRRQIGNYMMECDSCAAINGAKMTARERAELKTRLKAVIDYIDKNLNS